MSRLREIGARGKRPESRSQPKPPYPRPLGLAVEHQDDVLHLAVVGEERGQQLLRCVRRQPANKDLFGLVPSEDRLARHKSVRPRVEKGRHASPRDAQRIYRLTPDVEICPCALMFSF